jgi:Tfp pilus assembly protein PilV
MYLSNTQQEGFSLIEALLSVMIFSTFLLGMWQLVNNSFIHFAKALKVEQLQHQLVQAGEQQFAYPQSDLDSESASESHALKVYPRENYIELSLCDEQQKNLCASLAIQNLKLDFP